MLEHDPDKLFNLAVDAFGNYITRTVEDRQRTAKAKRLNIKWMSRFSGNVHQALGNVMLSSHDANNVTVRLLTQLDMFLWKTDKYCNFIHPSTMSYLTSALVHPAVTHLNFLQTEVHFGYSLMDYMLSRIVCRMNNLKVLHLDLIPWYTLELSFPNLQELTFVCDDNVLRSLWINCDHIRKLNLASRSHVTDIGIRFLVEFEYLEELNIKDTCISDEDLTQLLTDLSKNKDSEGVSLLKSLGCRTLDPQQLQLLANNFQNLVKLELNEFSDDDDDVDVSLLRNLKHLQSLTIHNTCILNQIVELIGHQLKELVLTNSYTADNACSILKYCPSLVHLYLERDNCSHVFEMTPHCNLKSLKVVDLKVDKPSDLVCFILSNCTNVRVLKIMCIGVNSNELATAMLQNNPLELLEELHWWSVHGGEPLLPEVGCQIVRHCKNLEVMYGNIWWTRRRSRKPWFHYDGVGVYDSSYRFHIVHPRLI